MSRDKEHEFAALLSDLGFGPEDHQTWTLWRLPEAALAARPEKIASRRHPSRLPSPWLLRSCELAARKTGLTVHKLHIELDQQAFIANLDALTKKYFGARTSGHFVYQPDGAVWCLFEFTQPNRKDKDPEQSVQDDQGEVARGVGLHGIGGFKLRLMASGLSAQVVLSELFAVGYAPHSFASMPLRFVTDAICLRTFTDISPGSVVPLSLYELRFPVMAPVLAHLGRYGASPDGLQSVQTALGKGRSVYSPSVLAGGDGFHLHLPSLDGDQPQGMCEVVFSPIEVLEARETAASSRPIDTLIFAGKLAQALTHAQRLQAEDPQALYLLRRMALLSLVGVEEPGRDAFVAAALSREPEHKLFVAAAVRQALTTGAAAEVLKHLSQLGALLMTDLQSAEHIPVFDLVLPELLGDAWGVENADKGADCYHRILERRGDLPYILRKLIHLARQNDKPEAETAYLYRLAAVERRRTELAHIYFRLAELRAAVSGGTEDAILLAHKALKLDRGKFEAQLLAARLQVDKGRFEEAIQGLDGLLKDPHVHLPTAAKYRLEAAVGHIWNNHLRRSDLAQHRYEQALRHDPSDLMVLKELEKIYRQTSGRLADLARILEWQFNGFERAGQQDRLKPIFDELVTLYRGPLAMPRRALEWYQRLLSTSTVSAQDLDLLLGWHDVAIDWPEIYGKLLSRLPEVPEGKRRADLLCRLAEICRDKLFDRAAAIRHLRAAHREGAVDARGFAYLIEHLAQEGDYRSLVQIYERRIKQVPTAEKQQLLLELLALPGELTDEQRDNVAVEIIGLDREADASIKKRFQTYQGNDDTAGIMRLLNTIVSRSVFTAFERLSWMEYALSCLSVCDDPQRFFFMDQVYRQQLQLSEDPTQVLHNAVMSLKEGSEPQLLVFYVQSLLKLRLLPALSERVVEALLARQDQELALYHELMSAKTQGASTAANHARIAAALYSKRPDQEAKSELMLTRLCTLVACAEDDLNELKALVNRSGHWPFLARALQKQADLEDERRRKFSLLEQLGNVYWHKIQDIPRARLTYAAALPLAPEPQKIKLVLAALAAAMDDHAEEVKQLFDFLLDAASTLDIPAMTRSVGRLLKLREDASSIQRLVQPHVEQAYNRGLWEMAGRLAGTLLDNNLVSSELHKIALKAATVARQPEQVISHWWRGLACVANKSKLRSYLTETTNIIQKADYKHLLLACYQAAFEHQIGDRIGPKIKHELTLQYAALLFDQEKTRPMALTVYAEACDAEPDDYRTWMPLYFLLIEYGTPSERLEHLRIILPKLKLDPRPLKSFPLTIESLQVELTELEQQVKSEIKQGRKSPRVATEDKMLAPPASAPVAAREEPDDLHPDYRAIESALYGERQNDRGGGKIVALETQPVESPEWTENGDEESDQPAASTDLAAHSTPAGELQPLTPDSAVAEAAKPAQTGAAAGELIELDLNDFASPAPLQQVSGEVGGFQASEQPVGTAASRALALDLFSPPSLVDAPAASSVEMPEPVAAAAPGLAQDANIFSLDPVDAPNASTAAVLNLPLFALSRDKEEAAVAVAQSLSAELFTRLSDAPDAGMIELAGAGPLAGTVAATDAAAPAAPAASLDLESFPGLRDVEGALARVAQSVNAEQLATAAAAPAQQLNPFSLHDDAPPPPLPLASVPSLAVDSDEAAPAHGSSLAVDSDEPAPAHGLELDLFAASEKVAEGDDRADAADDADDAISDDIADAELSLYEEGQAPPPRYTPPAPSAGGFALADASRLAAPELAQAGALDDEAEPTMTLAPGDPQHGQEVTSPSEISNRSSDSLLASPNSPVFAVNVGTEGVESDWRAAVIKGDFNADLTSRLLQQAFASELEKHLAIQCVALVGGNCERLSNWHWRVWRKPEEFGYNIANTERFPQQMSPPALHSTLHKYLIMAAPLLVRAYREHFSISFLQKRLGLNDAQLTKLRKPLEWNKGILKDVGLSLFAESLIEKKFAIFSLNGLGADIFFDGIKRAFYIDEVYYRKVPPSHLFHKLLEVIWAVRTHYFVPLSLNVHKELLPFLGELHAYLSRQGFSKFKSQLSGSSKIGRELRNYDLRALRDLHEKLGMPPDDQVIQLWEAMQVHLYRLILSETLDVIGFFESLLKEDLLRPGVLRHSEIYQRSPYAKGLIEFVTKLNI